MNRFYVHCPNCHTRMVRTGKKEEVGTGSDFGRKIKLYEREYECPNCERVWVYDEVRNWIRVGSLKGEEKNENQRRF